MFVTITFCHSGIEEQRRIAELLFALDTQIAAASEKVDAVKTHKKGLTPQLFPSPEGA
jgi:type I restriction enzyme S subunit